MSQFSNISDTPVGTAKFATQLFPPESTTIYAILDEDLLNEIKINEKEVKDLTKEQIKELLNTVLYIGQTYDPARRFSDHQKTDFKNRAIRWVTAGTVQSNEPDQQLFQALQWEARLHLLHAYYNSELKSEPGNRDYFMKKCLIHTAKQDKERVEREGLILAQKILETTKAEAEKPKFTCTECGKVEDTHWALMSHILMLHSAVQFCDSCEYYTSVPQSMTSHKQQKHKSYLHKCPLCNLEWSEPHDLATHLDAHFKKLSGKCFTCSYTDCDKTYTQKCHLSDHITFFHLGLRFKCERCPNWEGASSRSHLGKHKRNVHDGKRYVCEPCEQTFTAGKGLNAHKRTKSHIKRVAEISEAADESDSTFKLSSGEDNDDSDAALADSDDSGSTLGENPDSPDVADATFKLSGEEDNDDSASALANKSNATIELSSGGDSDEPDASTSTTTVRQKRHSVPSSILFKTDSPSLHSPSKKTPKTPSSASGTAKRNLKFVFGLERSDSD